MTRLAPDMTVTAIAGLERPIPLAGAGTARQIRRLRRFPGGLGVPVHLKNTVHFARFEPARA
ncbi:MAG: hypothetical protein U1D06_15135 [Paracoccaceae bacterium]|nr:hypothetical protein [Paracoccaceae bacterium]